MRIVQVALTALVLAFVSPLAALVPACAKDAVDLNLVLTVDVSLSMDRDEQQLQRDGYVSAFRDPAVIAAIGSGAHRKIAVTYVEWAGEHYQSVVIPWMVIDGAAAAEAFASELERKPITRERMTSISAALRYASRLLDASPFAGTRNVIDVSGDGPNNAGPPVVAIRDDVIAKGTVVNGLPLLLKAGGYYSSFDIPNLDEYYADCVVGGAGAFSLPVKAKEEFAAAIRQKLILEIAGVTPAEPRLWRTQSHGGRGADCLIGEKLWRRYMDR